jgi:hypothetical protein
LDNTRCRRLLSEHFHWSGGQREALATIWASATPVYEFQLILYAASWPEISSGHAILTAGPVAMSALVVLAGRLPADTQAPGDVGPPDPQADCVVDQQCQLGVQFVPLQPCPADPF